MTLQEFINSVEDLTDKALVQKFRLFLEECEQLCDDPDILREEIQNGLLDKFGDIESNDVFGTEGMDL